MGRIVKASQVEDLVGAASDCRGRTTDEVAAEVTGVLLAARVAADAERAAAKEVAVLLARKMAEKVVGHAVDVDGAVMADIARQALLASRARGASVVLKVHPDDLAAVESSGLGLGGGEGAASAIRFVADASVGRYGCVVETAAGRVDARLATQLDLLQRALGRR